MGAPVRLRLGAAALGALVAVALGGCGAAGGAAPPGGASPTPTQVLTDADSGTAITLAVGQRAELRLSTRYTEPQASGGAVRVAAGDSTAAYRVWTITAVGRGTATVTSGGKIPCSPGDVCPGAIRAFTLAVTVN